MEYCSVHTVANRVDFVGGPRFLPEEKLELARVKRNYMDFSYADLDLIPSQMWKYFDPDSDAAFVEPEEPERPEDEPFPKRNEPIQVQSARTARNQRHEDLCYKNFGVFRENERKWDRY